jgi:hypothetical protein
LSIRDGARRSSGDSEIRSSSTENSFEPSTDRENATYGRNTRAPRRAGSRSRRIGIRGGTKPGREVRLLLRAKFRGGSPSCSSESAVVVVDLRAAEGKSNWRGVRGAPSVWRPCVRPRRRPSLKRLARADRRRNTGVAQRTHPRGRGVTLFSRVRPPLPDLWGSSSPFEAAMKVGSRYPGPL